ncbi:MAG: integration host factor subunit alpha [Deltaproteobacteria bacterium]|nr:integration host factor subunit alpha [Deltaproteobacteria bacterium]
MTKSDLINRLVQTGAASRTDAQALVDAVFAAMKESLVAGETVKLHGFGNFLVRDKAACRGRNPKTGAPLAIPAHRAVRFHASPVLRGATNMGGQHDPERGA